MTNDPQTNPALATFAEKITPPMAEALRVVELAGLASDQCNGAQANWRTLKPFMEKNLSHANPEEASDAKFLAHRPFQNLTFVDVAYRCAGLDYLFGPKGVVLPNAVTMGAGTTKTPGDSELNPYVKVPN